MLNKLNEMVKTVKGCLGNDSMVDMVDMIDEMQYQIDTEQLSNTEMIAYNELQNVLYDYYKGM